MLTVMTPSRVAWLSALLACIALLAGCGSSSSSSSQGSSSAATTTPAPAATSSSTPGTSSPLAGKVSQAIAACKQQIAAQSSLPAKAKAKLDVVCVKAANGDKSAVKQAAREICEEVITSSGIPAGAARNRALTACKGKGK